VLYRYLVQDCIGRELSPRKRAQPSSAFFASGEVELPGYPRDGGRSRQPISTIPAAPLGEGISPGTVRLSSAELMRCPLCTTWLWW
jgi:hypothetical protein